MSEIETAWVAGLLEGEGCFSFGPVNNRRNPGFRQLRVTCSMTDPDVIQKLTEVTGIGNFNLERRRRDKRRAHAKPLYVWQGSRRADMLYLLNAIQPHMGSRRGARIQELLDHAAEHPPLYDMEPPHGDRKRYRNKGCRCDPCVHAFRIHSSEKARQYRKKAKDAKAA